MSLWDRRHELRIGMVLGIGAEWIVNWEQDYHRGGKRLYHPQHDSLGLAHEIESCLGLSGPSVIDGAACASANIALGVSREWLRQGWVDVCLTGGCECSVTPAGLAGFGNLGALSKRNDAPTEASRPFDRGRDGFVVGEGGALFVVEHAAQARLRRVTAYGELAWFGASSDAHCMAGAALISDLEEMLKEAGFQQVRIRPKEESKNFIRDWAPGLPVTDYVVAATSEPIRAAA